MRSNGLFTGTKIPGLDGLRAISILLVMASHSGLQGVVPGVFGVTVFFFISGFLITTLLLREHEAHGRICLRTFYVRRLLWLYPPLIVFILISTLAWIVTGHQIDLIGIAAALGYLANYASILIPESMRGVGGQLWSLAVEEHFYALYPLLVMVLAPRLFLALPVVLGLCALSLGLRFFIALSYPEVAAEYIGKATETRVDAILFGAAAALMLRMKGEAFVERWTRPGVVMLAFAALLFSFLIRDAFFRETIRYTIQSIALVPLVLAAAAGFRYVLARKVLESWPMVQIGKLSYSLYLWHLAGLALGEAIVPGSGWNLVMAMAIGWAASFLFATASYWYVELPLLGLRRQFGSNVGGGPAAGSMSSKRPYTGPERRLAPRDTVLPAA